MKKILTLLFIVSGFLRRVEMMRGKKMRPQPVARAFIAMRLAIWFSRLSGCGKEPGNQLLLSKVITLRIQMVTARWMRTRTGGSQLVKGPKTLLEKMNLNEKVGFINAPGLSGSVTA